MMPGQPGQPGGGQIVIFNKNTKREVGRKAQMTNIQAGKTVAGIVRTTLGPRAMLKMLLDPMGGIVMTNDGNAILREIDVSHPAARNMLELSRAQDEEVGDGTTSVIVLGGEMLSVAEPLLTRQIHPTVIVAGYMQALEDALKIMESIAIPVNIEDANEVEAVVKSAVDTKFSARWDNLISSLSVKAAMTVLEVLPNGKKEIDIKRFAKVEKIPGGELSDCKVLGGVMLNKDVTHPRMRRMIKKPRVVLMDCPLEYKKGESQTNVECMKESDWEKLLQQEEEEVKRLCDEIIRVKPDVVLTEKGVSDLAQHFLMKANISVVRRVRKSDNQRLARVTGALIASRAEELQDNHIGERCGLFEIKKIGDEYFAFFTECENPGACTVLLRGGSKDVLNEVERNLHDGWNVARNIILEPKLLPGGGATEMEVATRLKESAKSIEGSKQFAYKAVADALEVIPRILAHNVGADVVRIMTDLRSRHAKPLEGATWGVDGNQGAVADTKELGILDSFNVKQQILKSAIEMAAMLLRIDDIVSGVSKKKKEDGGMAPPPDEGTFGDARDG